MGDKLNPRLTSLTRPQDDILQNLINQSRKKIVRSFVIKKQKIKIKNTLQLDTTKVLRIRDFQNSQPKGNDPSKSDEWTPVYYLNLLRVLREKSKLKTGRYGGVGVGGPGLNQT